MRRLIAFALALLLWCPALAHAADRTVSLESYTSALEQGAAMLDEAERSLASGAAGRARLEVGQAAAELTGVWEVATEAGALTADLSELATVLQRAAEEPDTYLATAQAVLDEYLRAAAELAQAGQADLPGARQSLELALQEAAGQSVIERLRNWFAELLSDHARKVDVGPVPPGVMWLGGIIGALALGWIGFSLYRSLRGHGAGGEQVLRQGSQAPERPPTPAELRESARTLAARGEYLEALRLAHLALIQHYDDLKLIRYQPALTNRELERQVRRFHPELVRTLRMLNDLMDDRLYSGRSAEAEDYMKVEALVEQLWREGDAASRHAEATPGRSSSALSH